jgi:hypothetical protein
MRLLKASDIQPQDDPARTLARKREAEIKKALLVLLGGLITLFSGPAIIRMLSRLDGQGLGSLLNGSDAEDLFVTGYQPIADTFLEAARQAANDELHALVPYDPLAAAVALQQLRNQLSQAIATTAQQTIRQVLLDSLRTGSDPASVAIHLRQVIGLDAQSAAAVQNYERMLQAGDLTALRRALRDERYDDLVRETFRGGRALDQEAIDRMVQGYADRMLNYRASRMAATEAMQAAVSGIRDAYTQAVNSGRLFDSEVRRYWLTAADELVCPVCTSIPLMNENGVGVNDDYKSINGPIDAPLAHPNCRCSERYVANTSRLTEQPFRLAA